MSTAGLRFFLFDLGISRVVGVPLNHEIEVRIVPIISTIREPGEGWLGFRLYPGIAVSELILAGHSAIMP